MAVLPSSLIFAVILAVWAAYLMQHWVRRRDHIATARSVDRFSEAMRVLERHQHRPRLDLSEPVAPSYALSPARPASPDVMVKRAVPGPARPVVEQPGVGGAAATIPSRADEPAATRARSARVRSAVLLTAAGVMVAGTALGTVGVLPWWTAAVAITVFVVTLLAVRHTVRRTAARRAVSRPLASRPRRRAGKVAADPASTRRSAAAAGGGAAAALAATASREARDRPGGTGADSVEHTPGPEVAVAQARTSEVYDIDSVVQVVAEAPNVPVNASRRPIVQASEPAPGTWQPVPVPPPTYTLKAKAVTFTLPDELPADGTALSLEEEFEDLPVAIRDLA